MYYNVIPALEGAARGIGFPHQVGAFLVVHRGAMVVDGARGDGGSALERDMARQAVDDVFPGRGAQGLHVRVVYRGHGRVLFVQITA